MDTTKTLPQWKKIFTVNLRKLINASGLTDNEYRQQAGYSSQTWYCYVHGTRLPSNPSDIEKLAAVAGANPASLFGWHDLSALPHGVRQCRHTELTSRQLGYAAGSMVHYDDKKRGLVDGLFIIQVNGAGLLRRITSRLDGKIEVSDGEQTQAYSAASFAEFNIMGQVVAVTAML
ncbi:MAG: hypothetical protein RPR40_07930 [Bermanella sp.]